MKALIQTGCIVLTLAFATAAPAQDEAQATKSRKAAIALAQADVDKAEHELRNWQGRAGQQKDSLAQKSGLISASPESVRQLAERLQSERETMQLEEAGAKGRDTAIAEAIEKTTQRARSRADADEVSKQLEAVVAVRQKQLERVRQLQATGAVPNAEIEAAEAALATARAESAAARQKISGASTDLLEALNRELINLAIARMERQTKLQFIENRLKQLAPALAEASDLEMALHQFQHAQVQLDAALDRLRTVQRAGQ